MKGKYLSPKAGLTYNYSKGRAEGREEGEAIGARKAALENARKMKADGMADELTAKYTGLSLRTSASRWE